MSNVYHKLYYHIVWGTKNREPIITPTIEELIKYYIPKKVIEYDGVTLEFNTVSDHIHLLCGIPPRISISEFVNKIKGSSSRYINIIQNEVCFYWQSGYGILSVSEKDISFVRRYIRNQKQHHKKNEIF